MHKYLIVFVEGEGIVEIFLIEFHRLNCDLEDERRQSLQRFVQRFNTEKTHGNVLCRQKRYLVSLGLLQFELEVASCNETVEICGKKFGLGEYCHLPLLPLQIFSHISLTEKLTVFYVLPHIKLTLQRCCFI